MKRVLAWIGKTPGAGDTLRLVTANVVGQGLLFASIPLLTRIYSPEDFGVFEVFMSIAGPLSVVCHGRYTLAVMVPESKREARHVVFGAILLITVVSVVATLVLALLGTRLLALVDLEVDKMWLLLLGPAAAIMAMRALLTIWHARERNFGTLAANRLMLSGTTVVAQGSTWLLPGLAGFMLTGGRLVADAATTSVLWVRSSSDLLSERVSLRDSLAALRRFRDFPMYMMWTGLLSDVELPTLILAYRYPTVAVGFYAVAKRVTLAPAVLVAESVSTVFYRQVVDEVRACGNGRRVVLRTFGILAAVAAAVFLALGAGLSLLPWLLGDGWSAVTEICLPLLPLAIVRFAIGPLSKTLSALERQRVMFFWQIGVAGVGMSVLWLVSSNGSMVTALWAYSVVVAIGYVILLVLCVSLQRRDDRTAAPEPSAP